jgi:hypothetical protein
LTAVAFYFVPFGNVESLIRLWAQLSTFKALLIRLYFTLYDLGTWWCDKSFLFFVLNLSLSRTFLYNWRLHQSQLGLLLSLIFLVLLQLSTKPLVGVHNTSPLPYITQGIEKAHVLLSDQIRYHTTRTPWNPSVTKP